MDDSVEDIGDVFVLEWLGAVEVEDRIAPECPCRGGCLLPRVGEFGETGQRTWLRLVDCKWRMLLDSIAPNPWCRPRCASVRPVDSTREDVFPFGCLWQLPSCADTRALGHGRSVWRELSGVYVHSEFFPLLASTARQSLATCSNIPVNRWVLLPARHCSLLEPVGGRWQTDALQFSEANRTLEVTPVIVPAGHR